MRFGSTFKTITTVVSAGVLALSLSSNVSAQEATAKISGKAVVGENTVQVGVPFTIDIWLSNGSPQKGFTLGFALSGKDGLKTIKHAWESNPTDSGFDPSTNIYGLNGFDDASIWDMTKMMKKVTSWDGSLPDTALIGGASMNKGWETVKDLTHYVSFALQANEPGTLCVDSAFVAPGGAWLFAGSDASLAPKWDGPFCFKVVKGK